ncbi:MAG: PG0541 family transporter-associated protein [Candidatus Omnitrophota bacterium]
MSLKMAMVVYNEALDMEVMEAMDSCGLKNYTKVMGVFGRGEASGSHLGNDIWPGRNNILYIACEDAQARKLIEAIKQLRKKIGHEGAKAFILPVEEIT